MSISSDVAAATASRIRATAARALQETAVPADDFAHGVTGKTAERLVGENHGIVGQPRISNDHRHAGGANGGDEGIGANVGVYQLSIDPCGVAILVPAGQACTARLR